MSIADNINQGLDKLDNSVNKGFETVTGMLGDTAPGVPPQPNPPEDHERKDKSKIDWTVLKKVSDTIKSFSFGKIDLSRVAKQVIDFGKAFEKSFARPTKTVSSSTTKTATGIASNKPADQQQQDEDSQRSNFGQHLADAGRKIMDAGKQFGKMFQRKPTPSGGGTAQAGEAASGASEGVEGGAGLAEAGAGAAGAVEGGEVAAGGAAAVGGGVAALASNPVGWIVGLVAAAAAAVVALGALALAAGKLNEAIVESNRKFADYSAAMSLVLAKYDIAKILSQQRIGNATAGTAQFAATGQEQFMKSLEPFIIAFQNIKNIFGGVISRLASRFLDLFAPFVERFNRFVEKWFGKIAEETPEQSVPGWLGNWQGLPGRPVPQMPPNPPRPMGRPFPIVPRFA